MMPTRNDSADGSPAFKVTGLKQVQRAKIQRHSIRFICSHPRNKLK